MTEIQTNNCKNNYKSMYLNTLEQPTKIINRISTSLINNDIQGSRSKFIQKPRKFRQNFINRNYDIEKANCKILIPTKISSHNSLKIDDIEGTHPKSNKFTTTRITNPLNPIYKLPQVEYIQFEDPKFIRNNLEIDDIDGVRVKQTFIRKMQRENKFTKNKLQINNNKKIYYYPYKNQNQQLKLKKQKLKRNTNPLQPQYYLQGNNYGFIKGSKTKINNQIKSNNYNLQIYDIQGTQPKLNNFIRPIKNQIQGSRASTLKKGIQTTRKTNPLQPSYNYSKMTTHQKFDSFLN